MSVKFVARLCSLTLIVLLFPKPLCAETVGLFYDSTVEQIRFCASDVKASLEENKYTVEIYSLKELSLKYAKKKVVIALKSDIKVAQLLKEQKMDIPVGMGEQSYALRSTSNPSLTYWVIGGDANGAMYGGFQVAENIKYNGFKGIYNSDEAPAILKRGVKLNFPFDKDCPTYGKTNMGGFEGTSYRTAIPDVWDYDFWTAWFDEMARNRYNTVSLWSCHPFTCLVKMEEYPDVAIQNVTGFDGYTKQMSIDEKIEFWRRVMKYAHNRGFEFLLFNWNVFTYGATGKYGIDDNTSNPATVSYMRKAMIKLFETYPDLDGFGITNGENNSNQQFLWETYGRGTYEYAKEHPERKIRFIHRWHWANLNSIKKGFNQLVSLSNVTFEMSYKYSVAHMYSTPIPTWMQEKDKADKELRASNLKTWLTVRNDEMYYHNWGDIEFAREYVKGILSVGSDILSGFYMGSDGYCPTRSYLSKSRSTKGILEIQRQWYMTMIWGRLSYNPNLSDQVFKSYISSRFPTVSAETLFKAWGKASSCIPKITELVQGSWTIDLNWWIEGCTSKGGFRTIDHFAACKVARGSSLCSIALSAVDSCMGKKSSYQLADEIERDAKEALVLIREIRADADSDLGVSLNNIRAMSYMSIYYAYKIRGATLKKASKKDEAKEAMGQAYCWWMDYSKLMSEMYLGMDLQRVQNLPNWDIHDRAVLKEYSDLGGIGIPTRK